MRGMFLRRNRITSIASAVSRLVEEVGGYPVVANHWWESGREFVLEADNGFLCVDKASGSITFEDASPALDARLRKATLHRGSPLTAG